LFSNHFLEYYDPTIEDSYRKQVCVDDETCLLDILDTAGQEDYSAMRDQYMRSGQGFILTYAITSRTSFSELSTFYHQILRVQEAEHVPCVLVGNKCDLEQHREVSTEEGRSLASQFIVPFFESSACTRTNVEAPFFDLVRNIRKLQAPKKSSNGKEKSSKSKLPKKCSIL